MTYRSAVDCSATEIYPLLYINVVYNQLRS